MATTTADQSLPWSKLAFFLPVHGNFSQVEHSAALLSKTTHSSVFIYGDYFNTEFAKMTQYYKATWGSRLSVHEFTVQAVVHQLLALPAGVRAVFILTASTNYGFGRAQKKLLADVHELLPTKSIDVFTLGHCMYGCESCGLSEHNVPLFFTRFFNKQLPYSTDDVLAQHYSGAARGTPAKHRVLVCPTIGDTSYLNNKAIIAKLAAIRAALPEGTAEFVVKLHGFCYLNDKERPHVLFSLSDADRQGVAQLQASFKVVPETQPNILPFFQASTIVVTDMNSSVPFESLYFDHLKVLVYHNDETSRQDAKYASLLNSFRTPEELEAKLLSALEVPDAPAVPVRAVGAEGKGFFHSKYGPVDGKEPERIAALRGWFDKNAKADTEEASKAVAIPSFPEITTELQKRFDRDVPEDERTPLDYLARGEQVPKLIGARTIWLGKHQEQLEAMGLPQNLWPKLFSKIATETFDAGSAVQFTEVTDASDNTRLVLVVAREEGLAANSDVFLIDHAWTTTVETAKGQLEKLPNLLPRMEALMGTEGVQGVIDEMWGYTSHYRISGENPEDEEDVGTVSIWYVPDEVGAAVAHSGESAPSFGWGTLILPDSGTAYTLIWPLTDLELGDVVTRDFVPSVPLDETNPEALLLRNVKLLPFATRLSRTSLFGAPQDPDSELLASKFETFEAQLKAASTSAPKELEPAKAEGQTTGAVLLPTGFVWSDVEIVPKFLTRPEFRPVKEGSSIKDADVVWLASLDMNEIGKDKLSATQFISQFPNERCITFKNELAKTIQTVLGSPSWFPKTFDLSTQLPEFVEQFRRNEQAGLDNHWIVKPWNLGRSKEITITKSLNQVIRLAESGPKIVCKYVQDPATWEGRKYDLRFIVLARSGEGWKSPEVLVYKTFWIRFANKKYELNDLDDYEKHFTVMNYSPQFKMTHVRDHQFVQEFREKCGVKGDLTWDMVRGRIDQMIGRVFQAATALQPGGLVVGKKSVAVYGVDVILDKDFEPVLEEVNFSPDCTRACNYDAEFYNKVFGALFLGELENVHRVL